MPPTTPEPTPDRLLRERGTHPDDRSTQDSSLLTSGALAQAGPGLPASRREPGTAPPKPQPPRPILLVPQPDARLRGASMTQTAANVQRVIREQSGIRATVEVTTPSRAGARSSEAVRVNVVNPANDAAIDRLLTQFGVVPDDPKENATARAKLKADLRRGVGVTLADDDFPQRSLIIVPDSPTGLRASDVPPAVTAGRAAALILHELSEAGGGEPEQDTPHSIVVDSKGTIPRLRTDEQEALRRVLVPNRPQKRP